MNSSILFAKLYAKLPPDVAGRIELAAINYCDGMDEFATCRDANDRNPVDGPAICGESARFRVGFRRQFARLGLNPVDFGMPGIHFGAAQNAEIANETTK